MTPPLNLFTQRAFDMPPQQLENSWSTWFADWVVLEIILYQENKKKTYYSIKEFTTSNKLQDDVYLCLAGQNLTEVK